MIKKTYVCDVCGLELLANIVNYLTYDTVLIKKENDIEGCKPKTEELVIIGHVCSFCEKEIVVAIMNAARNKKMEIQRKGETNHGNDN